MGGKTKQNKSIPTPESKLVVVVPQSLQRPESYLHRGEEEEGEAAAFLSHGCSPTELLNCGNSSGELEPH